MLNGAFKWPKSGKMALMNNIWLNCLSRAAVKAKRRGVGKLPKLDAKLEAAEVTVKAEHRGSGKPLKWSEKLEPAKVELQGQDQASTGLDDQDLEAARCLLEMRGDLQTGTPGTRQAFC